MRNPSRFIIYVAGLTLFALFAPALAQDLPSYQPPTTSTSTLEILASNGTSSRSLTIADIERLPMVALMGKTSPDESVTKFQGVLLKDFVAMLGAAQADQITVRGSDGYAADIPREDWERWPIVLVTRADGQTLSTRKRGPARVVYPSELHPDLTKRIYDDRSVWFIRSFEW